MILGPKNPLTRTADGEGGCKGLSESSSTAEEEDWPGLADDVPCCAQLDLKLRAVSLVRVK